MTINIEILDGGNNVLHLVRNSDDPDRDTQDRGGDSWRVYVEPAPSILKATRDRVIAEIKAHALDLIGDRIPALSTIEMLDLIVELYQGGAFASGFPAAGSDMEYVKDVYLYARTKIAQSRTATQAQLDAYNVVTDPSWP